MRKFLAILLTFVMLTGIIFSLPVTAFAEDICEENPPQTAIWYPPMLSHTTDL